MSTEEPRLSADSTDMIDDQIRMQGRWIGGGFSGHLF
jgi:hypothetical protein